MKKVLVLFGLSAALSMTAVGVFGKLPSKKLVADDDPNYIEMKSDSFTDYSEDKGGFASSDATYWPDYAGYSGEDGGGQFNYPFYALDTFFRGETKEGWTGTLNLKPWKQKTQYIYFTWGGANDVDDKVKLVFHYGENGQQTLLNNTFIGNPMMLKYFKIPDEDYALLDKEDGFDMYIEFVDDRPNNYGFHNFGYLHVNQTKEQVADAMRFYLNKIGMNSDYRNSQKRIRKDILNHYFGNSYLKEVFYSPVTNIDDDFESNDDFLKHWYFDYNYSNYVRTDFHFDKAIGTDSVRPEDTFMPFNKTDNGFFRGWFQNDTLGGFVNGDNSIYRFISRPFVLSNTGLVSVKMAGTASLHVIDVETKQDLVWANVLTFNTSGSWDNLAESDFNTVTMIRHVINLEAYIGKTIQLAIADVSDGGWSAIYFDELRTNYNPYPNFKVDAFKHNDSDVFKKDKYINSTIYNDDQNSESYNPNGMRYVVESDTKRANDNAILNHIDNSPANYAFNFLNDNYYLNRNNEGARISLLNAYLSLNSSAKAIVNASSNVLGVSDTPATVGQVIESWLSEFTQCIVSFDANGGVGVIPSSTLVNGSEITLPTCTFAAPQGKKFVEWNTEADGTGDSKNPNDTHTVESDVTFFAIWENTAQTDVENLTTKSSLSYAYTIEENDNYVFTSAKITFGGSISVNLWNKLQEENGNHIDGFGVLVADATALGEATLTYENASYDMFINVETKATPTLSEDEAYYNWNLRLNLGGATENYDDAIVAIAYIKVNGEYVYMHKAEHSVVSLANDYINNRGYGAEDFEGSLGALANLH